MNQIKHFVVGLALFVSGVAGVVTLSSVSVSADCNNTRLLTFPAWYRGVVDADSCEIERPSGDAGISNFIWKVALNVLEILIQIVAYASIGYIMWGGYTYMRSMGEPSNISRAKQLIQNAVIGLVLSLGAVVIISFIVGRIL